MSPSRRGQVDVADPHGGHGQFGPWVRQQVALVASLFGGAPIMAAYADVLTAPGGKKTTLLASLLACVVFLVVYWNRQFLKPAWSQIGGMALLVVGGIALWFVMQWQGPPIDPLFTRFGIGAYVGGIQAAVIGLSLIFSTGYAQQVERKQTLYQIAPALDRDQWQILEDLANTLVDLERSAEVAPRHARFPEAFAKSAKYLMREVGDRLKGLSQGRLELLPFQASVVHSYFLVEAKQSFRAVALDDIAYWQSPTGQRYLTKNIEMREAGVTIERIFVLRKTEARAAATLNVLSTQLEAGIAVSLIDADRASEIASSNGLVGALDFGVLDGSIVSHWRETEERVFGVELDPGEVGRYLSLFDALQSGAGALNGPEDVSESRLLEILGSE
jgi:hypothetical protein